MGGGGGGGGGGEDGIKMRGSEGDQRIKEYKLL